VRLEGLGQVKNTTTSSGIEPAMLICKCKYQTELNLEQTEIIRDEKEISCLPVA
jgi:hypothetical protein